MLINNNNIDNRGYILIIKNSSLVISYTIITSKDYTLIPSIIGLLWIELLYLVML
jgi:hypothetical protein